MRFVCASNIISSKKQDLFAYARKKSSKRNGVTPLTYSFALIFSFFVQKMFAQSRRKMAKSKSAAKKENLDDLKQELDIDYHKITSEELFQRFQTHPENVRTAATSQNVLVHSHLLFYLLCESNRV